MNKKIKVTSAAAAALASLVLVNANVNNEVKADTKPVNATKTTQKAQTPEEAARANVASAQKNVETEQGNVDKAQGDLTQAKKDAEKPNADYKAQSDKVNGLKKTADQKNDVLTDAQNKERDAQALADEAKDPAKAKDAKDAVAKQKDVVKDANKAKDAADQAVKNKNKEIDDLKGKVQSDTQDVNDKTNAKNQADQAVKTAEDALKGTGITEAKTARDQAQNKMDQTSSDLKEAKTKRDNLNNNNPKLVQQINNDLKTAQELLNQTQSKITQKDASLKNQQNNINNLNKELSNLKELNEDLNKNTLQFTDIDKYKKAYVDYFTNDCLSEDDIAFINSERNNPINEFKHSGKDKQETIADINNLTDNQVEELSLFMAHLINGLRHQLGWDNVSVTKGSLKFAKEIAQRYISDQRNGKWDDGLKITQTDASTVIQAHNWHDVAGINNIAKENGLDYNKDNLIYNNDTQKDKGQYYEEEGDEYFDVPITMDQLKEHLFNTIKGMVFTDGHGMTSAGDDPHYELGHAASVLGASEDVSDGLQKIGYLSQSDREDLEGERQWLKDDQERLQSKIKELAIDQASLAEAEKNHDAAKIKLWTEIIGIDQYNIQHYKDEIEPTKKEIEKSENGHIIYVSAIPTSYKSISGIPGMSDSLFGDFHFLTVPLSNVNDKSKFDTTVISSYADRIADLNTKIKKANYNLNKAKQELGKLKEKATKITEIKQAIDEVAGLSQQLETDTETYNSANNKYLDLTASQDQKVKNYKSALKDQKSAKDQLGIAIGTLTQAKKDLDQAQNVDLPKLQKVADQKDKDATQAQTKLDQLKQHVEDLKNATTILANAKQAVDDAQTAYDTAKKNYDDANKVLNGDLKTNKYKADAKVVAAQKAYDEAVAKLQAAKDALAKAQQKLQDILDAEYAQSIITSGPVETKKTNKQEPVKTPEATPETKTDDISTTSKKIRLTHNAFVYNKHGKLVRKGLHIKWIKRDKLVKVLKNAKIVKINGKRYYQIGRNKFVKVANFEITTHAVHFKARLKGNKKVRAYNRVGKFNKNYARPNHTYTFNEKAKIHGKTYYKIAGTNNWIPAKKLALKK